MEPNNILANAAGYYATNAGLLCYNRLFAVVWAGDYDLDLCIVRANETSFQCAGQRRIPSLGAGPVTRALSEKIVQLVNMSTGLIPQGDQDAMDREVRFRCARCSKMVAYMEQNPDKESIKLKAYLECDPNREVVINVPFEPVRQAAANYTRQYLSVFNEFLAAENVPALNLEKVILVGDTLMQDAVAREFMRLGENDVIFYPSSSVNDIMAWTPPAPDTNITQFMEEEKSPQQPDFTPPQPPVMPPQPPQPPVMPPPPPPQPIAEYREIGKLIISKITQGTRVRMDTFDSTPGKGAAYQELEYLGDGLFKVLSCNRSLVPGDIVKPYAPEWVCGIQVDEEITRGASSLGRFRTRVVVRISAKNCYEKDLMEMAQ